MRWVELDWLDDAELLGRIGRYPLAAVLDLLAPVLAQQDLTLPDPGLPDARYFIELAAVLRSQPIKLTAYLPPFVAPGSRAQAGKPPPGHTTPPLKGSVNENVMSS